jgi:hypothetical protein
MGPVEVVDVEKRARMRPRIERLEDVEDAQRSTSAVSGLTSRTRPTGGSTCSSEKLNS